MQTVIKYPVPPIIDMEVETGTRTKYLHVDYADGNRISILTFMITHQSNLNRVTSSLNTQSWVILHPIANPSIPSGLMIAAIDLSRYRGDIKYAIDYINHAVDSLIPLNSSFSHATWLGEITAQYARDTGIITVTSPTEPLLQLYINPVAEELLLVNFLPKTLLESSRLILLRSAHLLMQSEKVYQGKITNNLLRSSKWFSSVHMPTKDIVIRAKGYFAFKAQTALVDKLFMDLSR